MFQTESSDEEIVWEIEGKWEERAATAALLSPLCAVGTSWSPKGSTQGWLQPQPRSCYPTGPENSLLPVLGRCWLPSSAGSIRADVGTAITLPFFSPLITIHPQDVPDSPS